MLRSQGRTIHQEIRVIAQGLVSMALLIPSKAMANMGNNHRTAKDHLVNTVVQDRISIHLHLLDKVHPSSNTDRTAITVGISLDSSSRTGNKTFHLRRPRISTARVHTVNSPPTVASNPIHRLRLDKGLLGSSISSNNIKLTLPINNRVDMVAILDSSNTDKLLRIRDGDA
jgi:hypothetical protein